MALQQTVMERGMNDENIRNANFTNSNEETNKIGITKSTAIIGRVIPRLPNIFAETSPLCLGMAQKLG